MVSEEMYRLGSNRSVIRELFEYGKVRAAQIGAENVFDFSIGNPNVPAPQIVEDTIIDLLKEENPVTLHGYTSAQGDLSVRAQIAAHLNKQFQTNFRAENLYMTAGAAASISICFKALQVPGDEFIIFAPYFPEYRCFIQAAGGKIVEIPAQVEDFQINFEAFLDSINEHTKAVVVNSPNNPSGVVYSIETMKHLTDILKEKSAEYGHPIYLITDEPYREITYDGVEVPYLTNYYENTLVCYSYSKSLSLPGERIGYIIVPDEVEEAKKVYAAICGAGRALGFVCAPSLFQHLVARCAGVTSDLSIYKKNRDLLYDSLIAMGYSCVKPEGAFYLFPKTLDSDAAAFCEKAKEFDLLLVPGDGFGCAGHMRISYCVQTEMIERALPQFEKLAKAYGK